MPVRKDETSRRVDPDTTRELGDRQDDAVKSTRHVSHHLLL